MQYKIFSLPLTPSEQEMEELNHFLRSHKMVDVKKELASMDGTNCWTFCVCYMPQDVLSAQTPSHPSRIDYKEVLKEEEFRRFSEMRKIRKKLAADDGLPAYAIFTDAMLADMAKLPSLTLATMRAIPGIGEKRAEKYGQFFCNVIQELTDTDEESGQSD